MLRATRVGRFSIGRKIAAAFAVLLLASLGLGGFAVQRMRAMNHVSAQMGDGYLPGIALSANMARLTQQLRLEDARASMAYDPHEIKSIEDESLQITASYDQARVSYEPLINTEVARQIYDRIDREQAQYRSMHNQLISMARKYQVEAAAFLFKVKMKQSSDGISGLFDQDIQYNRTMAVLAAKRSAAAYHSAFTMTLAALVVMVLICIGIGAMLIRSISAPINDMTGAMRRLADRDLTAAIPGVDRGDEIGVMAGAVRIFRDNMVEAERLAAEQERIKSEAAKERHLTMFRLADQFEAKVGHLVGRLASGSNELEATAQSMSGTAKRTHQQAATVVASAKQASLGVQTVASTAEELASSISEISRQVAQSANMTGKAVMDAKRTDVVVQALAEAAQKIGNVVALISNIAAQTNLLALNATIEAARAGDAGKGFAVVASEVKSLASQTARATEEIGTQVNQIQAATREAVEALHGITGTIEEVSVIATTIAAAIEEQGAATAEIARNVQHTAQATQEVTTNIDGVSLAANDTGVAAGELLHAAGELSRQAEQLSSELRSFVAEVRVA